MKNRFFVFIAAIILLPSLYAALTPYLYASEVKWHNYEEARALKSDKPILVFAKMRFCPTCSAMENDVFTDTTLAALLNEQFIPVRETTNFMFSSFVFNDLKDKEGNELSFKGFPAIMVVKGDNYAISHGYKSIEQLTGLLNSIDKNVF